MSFAFIESTAEMRQRKTRGAAEIDITPLIDVLFMLIIFFVLTASFVQGGLDVKLPRGEGSSFDAHDAAVLTVTADGRLFWNGREMSRSELVYAAEAHKGREILIAGDEGVPYGKVASVLSLLRGEGVTSAGLLLAGGHTE